MRLADKVLVRISSACAVAAVVRRYGPARVEAACAKALEVEVVDVTRIARMLERALEGSPATAQAPAPAAAVIDLRFARPKDDFAPKGGRR